MNQQVKEEKVSKTKKVELFIGVLGLLLAIASLLYTYFQFQSQLDFAKSTNIAQSKPHLTIEYNKTDSNKTKGMLLKNVGSGSAEIISFNLYPNRQAYESGLARKSWLDKKSDFWFNAAFFYNELNFLTPGHVVTAGQHGNLYLIGTNGVNITPAGGALLDKKKRNAKECQSTESQSKDKEEKICILKFSDTDDKTVLENIIIEIMYSSLSEFDTNIYTLTFSEKFIKNNQTTVIKRTMKPAKQEKLDKSEIKYET